MGPIDQAGWISFGVDGAELPLTSISGACSLKTAVFLSPVTRSIATEVQRLLERRQQLARLGGHKLMTVPVQLRDYFALAGDAFLALPDVALGLGKRVLALGQLRLESFRYCATPGQMAEFNRAESARLCLTAPILRSFAGQRRLWLRVGR